MPSLHILSTNTAFGVTPTLKPSTNTVTDLIGVVQELFCLACGGRKKLSAGGASAEHEFLHKDGGAFAKFSIYLDQMLPDGVVASLNIDLIDRMAKSKPVV